MDKSEAAKIRLGNDPGKRSERMSLIAKLRWSKMSVEDKKSHMDKMLLAKLNKKDENKIG